MSGRETVNRRQRMAFRNNPKMDEAIAWKFETFLFAQYFFYINFLKD